MMVDDGQYHGFAVAIANGRFDVDAENGGQLPKTGGPLTVAYPSPGQLPVEQPWP